IKPHPAEPAVVYATAAAGVPNVRIADAQASLPMLLAAASAVVTVNSTVAIDAMALGVPSLVLGLPNNLTPLVDRGEMTGASTAGEIRSAIAHLVYDQGFRGKVARAVEGSSASRSADAIVGMTKETT